MAEIVSWLWDFGDGEYSLEPNPHHIYKMAGTYTVKLTTTDSDGNTSTEVKDMYIHPLDWGTADGELNVTRTNKSYRLGLYNMPLVFKPSAIQPMVAQKESSDTESTDTNDGEN